MSDEREIIDVENYRVIDVREEPLDDAEFPPQQPVPPQQWSGRVYTSSGGGGCCLGASVTVVLVALIFLLGICFFVYLLGQAIGWAIPGL